MTEGKVIYLEDEQIDLVVRTLLLRKKDLEESLKQPEGLEIENIQELSLESRNLGEVVRELVFYAEGKTRQQQE